jgi:signal transduction histidine kinase
MQHRPPRGYWVGNAAVLALGIAASVRVSEPGDWEPVGLFAVLLVFSIAGVLSPVRLGALSFTATEHPAIVLAATLLGPGPAVAIAVADTLVDAKRRRLPLTTTLENLAAGTVFGLTGAVAFDAVATQLALEPGDWAFAVLVIVLYALMHALSLAIVSLQVRLVDGVSIRRSVRNAVGPILPLECIAAPLVGLVTVGYGQMGLAAVVGVLPFILIGSYLLRELIRSRERAEQVAALADGRRKLIAKALDAEDKARRDLAQGLHDNTIQLLLAAQQEMDAAQSAGDTEALARANESVRSAVAQLRTTTFDLHPAVLRHAGLAAALRTLAEHHGENAGFEADVQVDVDGAVPEARTELLFALAQELLVNAAKHAAASHVRASIRHQDGRIELEVRDDGRGFEPATRTTAVLQGHIGLASVAERTEEAGGSFTLESAPGAGTRVLVELPADA